MNRKCRKCGLEEIESISIEEHHIIPVKFGGTDKHRMLLCKRCHDEIQKIIDEICLTITEIWVNG